MNKKHPKTIGVVCEPLARKYYFYSNLKTLCYVCRQYSNINHVCKIDRIDKWICCQSNIHKHQPSSKIICEQKNRFLKTYHMREIILLDKNIQVYQAVQDDDVEWDNIMPSGKWIYKEYRYYKLISSPYLIKNPLELISITLLRESDIDTWDTTPTIQ